MEWLRGVYVEPVGSRGSVSGAVALFMVTMLTLAMISSVSLINWRTAPREMKSGRGHFPREPPAARRRPCRRAGFGSDDVLGALWIIGIAQQYQLFNWIDHRNYATHYRVVDNGVEVDPDKMFVRSLRGVLLDFYIHDITWLRIPSGTSRGTALEHFAANRRTDIAASQNPGRGYRYIRRFERIDPNGGPGEFDNDMIIRFSCTNGRTGVLALCVGSSRYLIMTSRLTLTQWAGRSKHLFHVVPTNRIAGFRQTNAPLSATPV